MGAREGVAAPGPIRYDSFCHPHQSAVWPFPHAIHQTPSIGLTEVSQNETNNN